MGATDSDHGSTGAAGHGDEPAADARLGTGLVMRAVTVMEAVIAEGRPVGPRALARTTGIDRSAVGRILQQLESMGMLRSTNGRYEPGPRLFSMGRMLSAQDSMAAAAASVLVDLVTRFDETSYVCMLHGNAAVFTYECQSSKPLRYVVELGKPVPLHAGAAGRGILLGLTEAEVIEVLGEDDLAPLTDQTICKVDDLLDLRRRDRELGYSISREERVEGGVAVAAPFFASGDRCQGSVTLTCPLSRFVDLDPAKVGEAVRAAAETLSARLGATGRPPAT